MTTTPRKNDQDEPTALAVAAANLRKKLFMGTLERKARASGAAWCL
jgi:hypothetical protein